jgi:putative NIF3 family GTP cyclohydrolase 1 type 2
METKDKKLASEKLNKLLKDIELYADHSNFDNVRWKLNDIGMALRMLRKIFIKNMEHNKQIIFYWQKR